MKNKVTKYDEKEMTNYKKDYSDSSFFEKLSGYAKIAGYEVVEKSLHLYYAMQEPGTPLKAKATITGALGYLILPIDLVPDFLPVVGYSDDLGVLVTAIGTVAFYINKNVKEQTKNKMKDWFE